MPDWNTLSLPDLYRELARTGLIERLIALARDEDLGPEGFDATAAALGAPDREVEAWVVAREAGIVAGLAAGRDIARAFGPGIEFEPLAADGSAVEAGSRLAMVTGPASAVLTAERTLLNLLGRLCGVATRTGEFVALMGPGRGAALYDTRKTTPGLRVLEKYAVRCGGGRCHRMGLHDAILIKDNHIAGMTPGALGEFILGASARGRASGPAFIEVEVDSLDQLAALLALPPRTIDFILLDNMDEAAVRRAVRMRAEAGSAVRLEVSGGITHQTIRAMASTGVERISTGSITHHAVWLDVALDLGPGGAA